MTSSASSAAPARALGFGFRVGHWSDPDAVTGCTVVLPPPGNVASAEVRGSSPGSSQLPQLSPAMRLTEIHAVLLTGGSAFGLAAMGGVMEWLERKGIGYRTGPAVVPIVPTAVIYDLGSGNAAARPDRAAGIAACENARGEEIDTGAVGAGTGATVGKWAGREFAMPGGIGIATAERDGERISALAVVNAIGDVVDADGSVVAGTTATDPSYVGPPSSGAGDPNTVSNTVLAVIATSANLDKRDVRFLAGRGSDGITVSVRPAHTRYDGDVVFAVAAPDDRAEPNLDVLGHLATEVVAEAVRSAVRA